MFSKSLTLFLLTSLLNFASAKTFLDYCQGTIGVDVSKEEADTVAFLKLALLPKAPWPVKIDTIQTYDSNGQVKTPSYALSYLGYAVPTTTKFTSQRFHSINEVTTYLRETVFGKKSDCEKSFEKLQKTEALQLTVGDFRLADGTNASYPLETIAPLEGATNLKFLILNQNHLTDVSLLKEFKKLEIVKMSKNQIESVEFVKHLPLLFSLDASENAIFDITPLKNAIQLKELVLTSQYKTLTAWVPPSDRKHLEDLSALSGLKNLSLLLLGNNNISDVAPLSGLNDLNILSLKNNNISEITNLENLLALRNLYLSNNHIVEAETLSNFKNLTALSMSNNDVKDCSVFDQFKAIVKLNFTKNPCK